MINKINGYDEPNGYNFNRNIVSNEAIEETVDLKPFLYRLLRNWFWVALSLASSVGLGFLYLNQTQEVYKVEGSLLIQSEESSGISQEDMLFGDLGLGGNSNLENEQQILKSFPIINNVLDTLNLDISYFLTKGIKTIELYEEAPISVQINKDSQILPSKFVEKKIYQIHYIDPDNFKLTNGEDTTLARFNIPFELDGNQLLIEQLLPFEKGEIYFKINDRKELIKKYIDKINIEQIAESDILRISLEDVVPQRSIEFVEHLIETYNKYTVQEKKRVSENTLQFIEERLQFIQKELYNVEKKAESYKNQNQIAVESTTSAGYYLDEISTSDKAIVELDFQKSFVENLRNYLLKPENLYSFLSSIPDIGEGTGFSASIQRYNDLLATREKLLIAANAANPQVQLLEEQISALRKSVIANLSQIDADLTNRINQLKDKVKPIVRKMNNIPRNQRELLQIMRQQQIKQSLFLFLLEKREETGLTLASKVADTRTINPPITLEKVAPNDKTVLMSSALVGLFIPIFIFYILEFFRFTIRAEEDIKRVTNTPMLGFIEESKNKQDIVVQEGKRSAIAEMFNLLRTNIHFMLPILAKERTKVLLVTSSQSGEGKTFVALNLAASLALSGADTLLMGFDLRKPRLSKILKLKDENKGISNYLAGMEENPFDLIRKVEGFDHLSCLGSGFVPPNPAHMILRDRTDELFKQLNNKFKYIIIDTPPVGLVTDALLLGKYADLSLYVARQGMTKTGQLKIIDDIYKKHKLPQPSIILNGVNKKYGYGYGYGYGYYEEDEITTQPSIIKKPTSVINS